MFGILFLMLFFIGCNNDIKKSLNSVHEVVSTGDMDEIKSILSTSKKVLNLKDDNGNTPLHIACLNGNLLVVEYLYSLENLQYLTKNKDGKTALDIAVERGILGIVKYLVENKPIGKKRSLFSKNVAKHLISVAQENGHTDIVAYLGSLYHNKEDDLEQKENNNDIHELVSVGDIDGIKLMLSSSKKLLNLKDGNGNAPLHIACLNGNLSVVEYLYSLEDLKYLVVNNDDKTALDIAVERGILEIVKYLVENKPIGRKSSLFSKNAAKHLISVAQENGHNDVVAYLESLSPNKKAGLEQKENNNDIHELVSVGDIDGIKLMLSSSKKLLNLKDGNGNAPLHIACLNGNLSVVEYLYSLEDLKYLVVNNDGKTALDIAVEHDNWDVVKYLFNNIPNGKTKPICSNTKKNGIINMAKSKGVNII